jgi:hypothetical protein
MSGRKQYSYDIFVSYASQDKEFVRLLVRQLTKRGLTVWFDEGEIRIGDSIQRAIEDALEHSRFFLVVVSQALLERSWAQFEIGVAMGRPDVGKQHILPVFRGINRGDLEKLMPLLADRIGLNADSRTVKEIADEIVKAVAS